MHGCGTPKWACRNQRKRGRSGSDRPRLRWLQKKGCFYIVGELMALRREAVDMQGVVLAVNKACRGI